MEIGYTLMCEQAGPKQLVRDAVAAESAGFDFAVISDHYFPWLTEQGHSPNAWSVLGAVAQATERLPLMTYVTCPIRRYHPAVVAQLAATTALLSDGRFSLGLGSGENLNEHIVGGGWPSVDIRHEMLTEAVEIIKALFDGGDVNYRGKHFDVESARLFDVPDVSPPIGIAVSGAQSCGLAGQHADLMIAVAPDAELGQAFDAAGGAGKPRYGQQPLSFDRDRKAAVARAHEQFRWFGSGWKVMAELPGPAAFDAASQFVRPEDVADAIPCGDDVEGVVKAARSWADAGFTHLALLQIGGDAQEPYFAWAQDELLPALRAALIRADLPLRNGPHGYGTVTKVLHWTTVAALLSQFLVGYAMEADDSGRGRGRGRGGESGRGRGRGGEDEYAIEGALAVHVALGVLILTLAVLRVLWRRTGLPPWAETLSAGERRFLHWIERALLTLLFAIPITGLVLVFGSGDDALPWHIASHVAFFVAVSAHVGLVLKHQFVNRDRLLSRMT